MAHLSLPALTGIVLLLGAGPAWAQSVQSVFGYWETRGDEPGEVDFIVELLPCREASGQLCCRIEWIAPDEPHIDTKNPDPGLHGRSLIGVQFFSGFEQEQSGAWTGGELYNPRDGQKYTGSIEQIGPNRLELKGCALFIFCRTQIWHRVPPGDPRLPDGQGAQA